jgi:hypothetical protein
MIEMLENIGVLVGVEVIPTDSQKQNRNAFKRSLAAGERVFLLFQKCHRHCYLLVLHHISVTQ